MTEMNCEQARELMLEADLADLRGESPLARHVATCMQCRRMVDAIFVGYDELNAGLATLTPHARNVTRHSARRIGRWAAFPLAAAAVLALLLGRPHETAPHAPTMLAELMFPDEPVVETRAGQQAIVVEKNDLTVVWLY